VLLERKIQVRRAVQAANQQATITHGDVTRSVADWLVWKREVVARRSQFLMQLRLRIGQARLEALRHAVPASAEGKTGDLVVHLNEKELAAEVEALEELKGYLDGQLSLKNATVGAQLPGDEMWQTGREGRIDEWLALVGRAVASPGVAGTAVWLMGLVDASKKIPVIKVVRELTGMGLADAKNFVEGQSRAVKEGLTPSEAAQVRQQLEAAGGRVMVR
jgi:hypothetical protein